MTTVSGAAHWQPGVSRAAVAVACPVCDAQTARSLPAYVSPFIAERAGLGEVEAKSRFCPACEHVFLTPFYTQEQLSAIYTGYRNAAYTEQRGRHEPSYPEIAPGLDDPASYNYQVRREYYNFFLAELQTFKGLVVDYGGGDGYFSRHVFRDAEIVVADEDFERKGGDLENLLRRADFLFAAHVFEHLPQPQQVLGRLSGFLRPGTPVYVELPRAYAGRLKSAYQDLERQKELGQPLPWTDLVVMHEHIGNFSKSSAKTLMARSGVSCDEVFLHPVGVMGFLGRKRT